MQLDMAQQQIAVKDEQITDVKEDLVNTDNRRLVAVTALTSKEHELNSWASTHAFSLLNLNDVNALLPYYAVRCKRRKMAATIKRLRQKHPRAEIIFQHRRVPNAVNMYDRLRNEKLVLSHQNYCTPANDGVALRAAMTQMCGQQFPPEVLLPPYSWIFSKTVKPTPINNPTHIIHQTPPASPTTTTTTTTTPTCQSPPYLPPSYHICTQCNRIEPSLLHLYIHRQNCNFNNGTAIDLTAAVEIMEPAAVQTYAPIPAAYTQPPVKRMRRIDFKPRY